MSYKQFNYQQLILEIKEYPNNEDKIGFISNKMLECKHTMYDIKNDFKKFEIISLEIKTNFMNINKAINNGIKSNTNLRKDVEIVIKNKIYDIILTPYDDFLDRADDLKRHYIEKLELELKIKMTNCQSEKDIIEKRDNNSLIVWKLGKDKLLQLFKTLHENEILPKYEDDEILVHFSDERGKKITFAKRTLEPFIWQDSDNMFSVFVDELVKRGAINEKNKYKNMSNHFINRENNKFKNLSQKKHYTENTTNTGNIIRKILDGIDIK